MVHSPYTTHTCTYYYFLFVHNLPTLLKINIFIIGRFTKAYRIGTRWHGNGKIHFSMLGSNWFGNLGICHHFGNETPSMFQPNHQWSSTYEYSQSWTHLLPNWQSGVLYLYLLIHCVQQYFLAFVHLVQCHEKSCVTLIFILNLIDGIWISTIQETEIQILFQSWFVITEICALLLFRILWYLFFYVLNWCILSTQSKLAR